MNRRSFGAMLGAGGLPRRRPDQQYRPSPGATAPGSRSGFFRRLIIFGNNPGQGLFVYSPVPGPSNLALSMALSNAGPYGEPVIPGITSYAGPNVAINLLGGLLQFKKPGVAPAFDTPALFTQAADPAGAAVNLSSGKGTVGASDSIISLLDSLLSPFGVPQVVVGAGYAQLTPQARVSLEVQGGLAIGNEVWFKPSGDATGATDRSMINNALSAGLTVHLLAGTWHIDAPIVMPTGAVLKGASGFGNPSANFGKGPLALGSTVIQATAGFAGAGMLTMSSSGSQTGGQRISGLALDGSAGPGGITGIQAIGAVAQVKLRDIAVYGGAGHLLTYGLLLNSNADGNPDAWDVDGCAFQFASTASVGILAGVADSYWRNVSCTASAGDAWKIINGGSSRFLFCKGETSAGFGFNIQGVPGFTGFAHFIGCSGESNTAGDFSLSGTGTGTFYLDFCHGASATPWTYAGTNNVRTPAAYNVSTVAPTLN